MSRESQIQDPLKRLFEDVASEYRFAGLDPAPSGEWHPSPTGAKLLPRPTCEGRLSEALGKVEGVRPRPLHHPEELPAFIHLSTDPSLPVKYVRTPLIPRAAEEEEKEALRFGSKLNTLF